MQTKTKILQKCKVREKSIHTSNNRQIKMNRVGWCSLARERPLNDGDDGNSANTIDTDSRHIPMHTHMKADRLRKKTSEWKIQIEINWCRLRVEKNPRSLLQCVALQLFFSILTNGIEISKELSNAIESREKGKKTNHHLLKCWKFSSCVVVVNVRVLLLVSHIYLSKPKRKK